MILPRNVGYLTILCSVATALACAAQVDSQEPPPVSLVGDPGTAPTVPDVPAPPPPRHEELPTCEPFTGSVHASSSIADVEARIAGVWFLCEGEMAAPIGTRGIELADGRGTFLVSAGRGLVRSVNDDHRRTASVVANADAYELRLDSPADAGVVAESTAYTTRLSDDGRFLELSTASTGTAVFVRAERSSGCEGTGSIHAYTSANDVSSRLNGRWRRCGGDTQGGPSDSLGLQFDGDRAYFLTWSQGALVHGPGWDYYRDVDRYMTGPNQCVVNLWSGFGQYAFFTRVTEDGDYLEMDGPWSSATSRYIRLP